MILTDRSMAAGAQSAHSVELMIGRRTSTDDWRGVGEPLNDVRAIRVPLTIYHGDMAELEMQRVDLSRNIRHPIDTVLYESTRFIDENHDMQLPLFNGWRMFSAQLIDYDGGSIKLLLRYQASPSASTKLTAFHVRRWLDNRHSSRGGGSDAINVIGINRINLAGTTVLTEDDDGTLKFQNDFSIDDSAAVSWELRAFLIHISI
jgi:hypothetical protein